jgi:replication fork protection complex subunit Tof1/Swi1
MSTSPLTSPTLTDAAELLQQQLVYNGEVLDIAVESLRSYKEGVQSLRYLDSSVRMAYTLLRMLERWSRKRGGEVYVRKRKAGRRGKRKEGAEGGEDDEEETMRETQEKDEEPVIQETMFSFEAFEIVRVFTALSCLWRCADPFPRNSPTKISHTPCLPILRDILSSRRLNR